MLFEFLGQFYIGYKNRELPHEIILNHSLADGDAQILLDVFAQTASRKITIQQNVRAQRKQWLSLAETTAVQNLNAKMQSQNNQNAKILKKPIKIKRLNYG